MKKGVKITFIVLSVIIGLALLIKLLTIAFVEPWIEKKIETALNEKYEDYKVEIDKVNILFLSLGVELETIIISPKTELGSGKDLRGEIGSIKLRNINLKKYLSDEDIEIAEISIEKGILKGTLPEPKKDKSPNLSPANIKVGALKFTDIELSLKHLNSAQTYVVNDAVLNIYEIQITKQDTLSFNTIKAFDFKAQKFLCILNDSMYTITASGIEYAADSRRIFAKDLIVHPNYDDYQFTARKKYQTDCIKATLNNISLENFSVVDYVNDKKLVSSYIEVERMDLHVFRDRRKEFHHIQKKMFQQLIYDFPGTMKIDSISLKEGNVHYTEHVEMAVQPGKVNFTKINAMIYNVTNDTIYKKQEGFLTLNGNCFFMGKGKMNVALKARLYDPSYAFYLSGGLTAMEAKEVNPMLEKNAFIFVTSGKVESIHFHMRADNYKATGKMTMLYKDMAIAVKSKKTNDTTALKEKVISLVANIKILDSNPEPTQPIREGVIDYQRDPEKFLFNYCFKSILTGLKSSMSKPPKEKKHKRNKGD